MYEPDEEFNEKLSLQSGWENQIFSRSTAGDSKQLDGSNNSSYIYDYGITQNDDGYEEQDYQEDEDLNYPYTQNYLSTETSNPPQPYRTSFDPYYTNTHESPNETQYEEPEHKEDDDDDDNDDGDEANHHNQVYEHWQINKESNRQYPYYDYSDQYERVQDPKEYAQPLESDYAEADKSANTPNENAHTEQQNTTTPNEYEYSNPDLVPFSVDRIADRIFIRSVPSKGRCAFARQDYKPGDIIFSELPTLTATASLDPQLWEFLKKCNENEAFELPPMWHLAAIYSLTNLSKEGRDVIFDKWVPDVNKAPSKDVLTVLKNTDLKLDPQVYERALQVWRFNSFGHTSSTDGLVLYNKISMLSHNCAASASWHYGSDDTFVLRARRQLRKGDEITISYVGDEDILKSSHLRQEKLSGWLFKCQCKRCIAEVDTARGFRCPVCGMGTVFFKTDKQPSEYVTPESTQSSRCTSCRCIPTSEDIVLYLNLEDAYINRLAEVSKQDLVDAEHVYSEAQRVFTQHWVLYQLDSILFEGYRDQERFDEAITCQHNRLRYVTQVEPSISYTLAWIYEELGDLYARKFSILSSNSEYSTTVHISGFQRNVLVNKYESAMNMFLILCGPEHDYTVTAHEKLEYVFNMSSGCFVEEAST